ncbi:hypothetical protein DIPPA_02954 [Diplonema papillatum]|nr:hypothetical protein DIPPA_02954 [Diplonema papillatum]
MGQGCMKGGDAVHQSKEQVYAEKKSKEVYDDGSGKKASRQASRPRTPPRLPPPTGEVRGGSLTALTDQKPGPPTKSSPAAAAAAPKSTAETAPGAASRPTAGGGAEAPTKPAALTPVGDSTSPRRKSRESTLPSPTPPPPKHVTKLVSEVSIVKDAKGNRKVNEYTVIRHLGSGRYGEVFLVQNEDGEQFAMKEVSKKLFTKSGESKEVTILTKIEHKNTVKLIAVLDDPNAKEQFMVLEYVDGGAIMNLNDQGVAKENPFLEDTIRCYFAQIVDGLQYLHDCNIIHRDIKPENILITSDKKTVKLADFGVSRAMASADDGSRETGGTPLFLSPEACRGDFSSGKSNDIWALGVTLYIFMYGRAPFSASKTELVLYDRILAEEIAFPGTPAYSSDLMALIRRMLERNVLLRITLNEIKNNSWVRGSSAPVPDEELQRRPTGKDVFRPRAFSPRLLRDARNKDAADSEVNILIVEDVFLIQKVTAKMFKSLLDPDMNTNITMVADGQDAIEACKTSRFHVVLMDVHMSRVSGVTATRKILEYEEEHNLTPTNIVGLTADPHEDMDRLCWEAGMLHVIQKPLQPTVLREICTQFELPVTTTETNFDATADFKKGEVRGGGENNAFLKLYQEHISKSQEASPPSSPCRSTPQAHREKLNGAPAAPPAKPAEADAQGGQHATNTINSSSESDFRRVTSDGSMTTAGETTSSGGHPGKMVGALSNDDMRSRSLQCMKNHANMYKKKNCDHVFLHVDDEELPFAPAALLQPLFDTLGWPATNLLSKQSLADLYNKLTDLEYWVDESRTLNGDVVPHTDLTEKVADSSVWHAVSDQAMKALADAEKRGGIPRETRHVVYIHADRGQRGGMEDMYSAVLQPRVLLLGEDADAVGVDELLVGVYDGHGGRYAALFCRQNLLGRIVAHPAYKKDVGAAMTQAILDTNRAFLKKVDSVDCDAGTTALVALLRDRKLFVANVGDCRIVIGRKSAAATQLNTLHVCDDDHERAQVEARGGTVIHYCGSWRVNGVLLVTRSIGDLPCKDVVTCTPDIHEYDLTDDDLFAVIASDGLWDVMTPTEVCDAVKSAKEEVDEVLAGGGEANDTPDAENAAGDSEEDEEGAEDDPISYSIIPEALISEAIDRGSGDNITCAVIFFAGSCGAVVT